MKDFVVNNIMIVGNYNRIIEVSINEKIFGYFCVNELKILFIK